jgi:hypothetical protein
VPGIGGATTTGAGATTTGAGATTTGAGTGIPKLIPKRTPAFAVAIPTAARVRTAIFVFIIFISWTRRVIGTSLQMDYLFVSQPAGNQSQHEPKQRSPAEPIAQLGLKRLLTVQGTSSGFL